MEPILERQFAEHSYGFRPHRGCKDALRRVDRFVKLGYKYRFNDKLSARHALIAMNAIHPERIAEISRWSPTGAPPVKKAWLK